MYEVISLRNDDFEITVTAATALVGALNNAPRSGRFVGDNNGRVPRKSACSIVSIVVNEVISLQNDGLKISRLSRSADKVALNEGRCAGGFGADYRGATPFTIAVISEVMDDISAFEDENFEIARVRDNAEGTLQNCARRACAITDGGGAGPGLLATVVVSIIMSEFVAGFEDDELEITGEAVAALDKTA